MKNNSNTRLHVAPSILTHRAGAQLIELLGIGGNADILDVGCGTGNLTMELSKRTTGSVSGIDPSEGMIREASKMYSDPRITFMVMDNREMTFHEEFDNIFCNSAFQWFRTPEHFLEKAYAALRPNGRIGIQAPAKKNYCPLFLKAIGESCTNPEIAQIFSGFRPPWCLLESGEEYSALFCKAGFRITYCSLEESRNRYTPEKVFDVFSSGAKAGYLNPAYYNTPLPEWFEAAFLEGIRGSFDRQCEADGLIDLLFYRIFLIAEK
ncbi:MAG: methyltransferase domain-containing protein [Chlorobiaceae bacterium]|nr:methyltransferase domain-containing protein [Chlorobiaceae bacterium]